MYKLLICLLKKFCTIISSFFLDAVVTAVKEFFEGSTIGEFQARLEMIETILMHLQTQNICKGRKTIYFIFWARVNILT